MQTEADCGPVALLGALLTKGYKIDRAALLRLWDWQDYQDLRVDLQDSPWHHFAVLEKLNIPWKIRTCGEVCRGVCGKGTTVILLHDLEDPYLKQHWVLFDEAGSHGNVSLHWGDGKPRIFSQKQFELMYSLGSPACAYEVGIGTVGLTAFQRLYVNVLNRFA